MKRLVLLSLLALAACNDQPATVEGYVEGEYLRVGLPAAGRVVSVSVDKGAWVQTGQPLFALDTTAEQAAVAEAKARLEQARYQRDNLLTGRRALEIRAIEAQKAQAEASMNLSGVQLKRQEELAKTDVTSRASLDNARATLERDRARVAELSAQLAFAHEGARIAEIAAAESAIEAATAALHQAEWRLGERTAEAPKAALVEDVLFRPGEDVAPGQPVVSLLPPDNVLFRFYLGPAQVGRITSGAPVKVACAGCPPDLAATVTFVAREASYAPPIIYSRENKDKLVFLVEARPTAPSTRLRPGQPVTITLPEGERAK